MNILCCLVHPVGTYLGKDICTVHLDILGVRQEYTRYLSSSVSQVVEWQSSLDIIQNRASWLAAHRRAKM